MKINIIGAGIAGLTAGCHLQLRGYETEIFEAHSAPGGLCTSWKSGEYTIDGCLHWLVGSNPSDPLYGLWNELIDMKSIIFHDYEEFLRVRDEQGKEIIGYTKLDRLHRELLEKAPEDRKLIDEFISSVKKISGMKMRMDKAPELYTFWDKFTEFLSYVPRLGTLIKYEKITLGEFSKKCRNPLLARFFEFAFTSEMPVLFIMFTFSWLNKKDAGYPIGGSLKFSRMFEQKYLELGGKVHYHSKVMKISTEKAGKSERACGLEVEGGDFYPSDITISAADGYSTIFSLLDGRFADDRVRHYYHAFPIFPPFIQVSLGVAKEFRDRPSTVTFPLAEPFWIDPEKRIENLYYRIVNYDPTLAPKGKTLIIGMAKTFNYRYWQDLRDKDREAYKAEKRRIADFYIEMLDQELGGIKDHLEMVDVATPATTIRYTHNWKGSVEGWLVNKETGFDSLPKELPGLRDFFMAGQWVEPGGGVPSAFYSGRNVAQVIARKYKV